MEKYDTSQLTEFPRFESESSQSSVSTFFNKFLKFPLFTPSEGSDNGQNKSSGEEKQDAPRPEDQRKEEYDDGKTETGTYAVELEGRSLPNVLRRISSLVAMGSGGGTRYADTELARYWMPDDISRECYECATRFSTLRRRHHCRVCGQIFCSRCCSQRVPGHIFGCNGGLRVCNYCCNVVLSYLKENDLTGEISPDLRTLQENLQVKFPDNKEQASKSRDNFAFAHDQEERCEPRTSPKETLQDVFHQLSITLPTQQHRYRLVSYNGVWRGCDVLQWIMDNTNNTTRIQASIICQNLLSSGYMECVTELPHFADYALYRPATGVRGDGDEDNDDQQTEDRGRLVESASSYCLDLNLGNKSARIIKTPKTEKKSSSSEDEEPVLEQNEGEAESKQVCRAISQLGAEHLRLLLRQCLARAALPPAWLDTLLPLCLQAADSVTPDPSSDDIDVRNYVQVKKVVGGAARDSCLVHGVVLTKNVAHRGMPQQISNPSILLLDCSIAYQRVEGKLTSLEPVLMQENEYLTRCAARITALRPKVVLVSGGAGRTVQAALRRAGAALALRVPARALQRLARCARADVLTSIDARIGLPRLGTCKNFYVKNYESKTLMVLEGCAEPQLGCCVLLRGASLQDLVRVKKVVKFMLLACYNWRLEKAFLRDIEAVLPEPGTTFDDELDDDNDNDSGVKIDDSGVFEEAKIEKDISNDIFKNENFKSNEDEYDIDGEKPRIAKNENKKIGNNENQLLSTEKQVSNTENTQIDSTKNTEVTTENIQENDAENAHNSENRQKVVKENTQKLSTVNTSTNSSANANNNNTVVTNMENTNNTEVNNTVVTNMKNTQNNVVTNMEQSNNTDITNKANAENTVVINTENTQNNVVTKMVNTNNTEVTNMENTYNTVVTNNENTNNTEVTNMENTYNTVVTNNENTNNTVVTSNKNTHKTDVTNTENTEVCNKEHTQNAEVTENSQAASDMTLNGDGGSDAMNIDTDDPLQRPKYTRKTENLSCGVPIRDFSDPLRATLSVEDDVFLPKEEASLKADAQNDRWSADDVVLSMSPNVLIPAPYLETEAGRRCPFRACFPSPLLPAPRPATPRHPARARRSSDRAPDTTQREYHPFVSMAIRTGADDPTLKAALANFRAVGGRTNNNNHKPSCPQYNPSVVRTESAAAGRQSSPAGAEEPVDPFSPEQHQQLHVLLYSYSTKSPNVPDFCVNPWVAVMEMYGRHDISLGAFLHKYCFNPECKCTSASCNVPMNQHVRKFVHGDVCITITCNTIGHSSVDKLKDEQTKQVMFWSRCPQCGASSRGRRLSPAALALSLAQYVRWRVAAARCVRGAACAHAAHRAHHAFQCHLTTACFRYSKISTYDIVLPPDVITTNYDTKQMRDTLISQLNELMLRGHETFNNIGSGEADKEYQAFKVHMENIHVALTAPALHDPDTDAVVQSLWSISDGIISGEKMLRDSQDKWSSPPAKPAAKQLTETPVEDKSDIEESLGDAGGSDNTGTTYVFSDNSSKDSDKEPTGVEDEEEKGDKKTVRQILSQLLSNNQPANDAGMVLCGGLVPVVVRATQTGSVIAAALASATYRRARKQHNTQSETEEVDANNANKDKPDGDRPKAGKSNEHVEVLLKDGLVCRVYYAAQFQALRHAVIAPRGKNYECCCDNDKKLCNIEEGFIRSLAQCVPWAARGGKSGSTFCKTKDDRYVLKEMTKPEWQQFLEFAPHYFNYVASCRQNRVPSLLARILGVYSVGGAGSGVLAMENVWCSAPARHTRFDLKGSSRHRLASAEAPRAVLMDENLLNLRWERALYVRSACGRALRACVSRDAAFLASHGVMDYSLLLALGDNTLVLGVIDYIRTFTWDKKLEHLVKKNLGSGQPTVVSPEQYMKRFCAASRKYFLQCPEHWDHLYNVLPSMLGQ